MVQVYRRHSPLLNEVSVIRLESKQDEAIILPSSLMNSIVQKTMPPPSQTWCVRVTNQVIMPINDPHSSNTLPKKVHSPSLRLHGLNFRLTLSLDSCVLKWSSQGYWYHQVESPDIQHRGYSFHHLIPCNGTTPKRRTVKELSTQRFILNRIVGFHKSLKLVVVQYNNTGDAVAPRKRLPTRRNRTDEIREFIVFKRKRIRVYRKFT